MDCVLPRQFEVWMGLAVCYLLKSSWGGGLLRRSFLSGSSHAFAVRLAGTAGSFKIEVWAQGEVYRITFVLFFMAFVLFDSSRNMLVWSMAIFVWHSRGGFVICGASCVFPIFLQVISVNQVALSLVEQCNKGCVGKDALTHCNFVDILRVNLCSHLPEAKPGLSKAQMGGRVIDLEGKIVTSTNVSKSPQIKWMFSTFLPKVLINFSPVFILFL